MSVCDTIPAKVAMARFEHIFTVLRFHYVYIYIYIYICLDISYIVNRLYMHICIRDHLGYALVHATIHRLAFSPCLHQAERLKGQGNEKLKVRWGLDYGDSPGQHGKLRETYHAGLKGFHRNLYRFQSGISWNTLG